MKIKHIMADGSVRESVEGMQIPNKDFYKISKEIRSKKNEKERIVQG